MQKLNSLLFFLILNFTLGAQSFVLDVTIKFRDSSKVSDQIITLDKGLKSISDGRVYFYKIIDEIIVHNKDSSSYTVNILEAKNEYPRGPSQMGIGRKVYDSEKLELFRILFGKKSFTRVIHQAQMHVSTNPNWEIFIRRKNEWFAYNIGFVDGYGWEGIRPRLRAFFYDCPDLISKMKAKGVSEREIFKIADLYNKECF